MPTKNIIFDLGGVLLNLDIPKTTQAFEQLGAPEFKNLFGLGRAESFLKAYEVGYINDDEFVTDLQQLTGGKSRDEVIHAWNAMLLDFPKERIEFLAELRKNINFICSAIPTLSIFRLLPKHFPIPSMALHWMLNSAKPGTAISLNAGSPMWKLSEFVIKDAELDPSETVFIDDALVNVEGARKAGLTGIHLEPGKTILEIDWNLS